MRLSIMFYPNLNKISSKSGKIPLYMRITKDRQKIEARLNIEIEQRELSKWNSIVMRFNDRQMSANALINTIEKKFEDFRHHNADKLSEYSLLGIRSIVLGKVVETNQKISIYLDKYYNNGVAPKAQMSEGTKTNYRKAIKHLKNFLQFRKSPNALLREIDISFAHDFKDYLLGNNLIEGKKGMKECSALGNVKRLRTIFDKAVSEELMPLNTFKKIKLKSKSAVRGRLDIHQVRQLFALDLSEFPTQQIYRDMFLFSIFTGLAYADAIDLKQSDLNITTDGNVRLFLQRIKTSIVTEMILPKHAVNIIDKYKQTTERTITDRVLPRRSNKEVNIQLKILANMVNIPVKLSTHIARHTFRQLLAEADIFEMGIIKRMMGHSSSNEIDGIYYQVTESRLLEAKRKFDLFLEKYLS